MSIESRVKAGMLGAAFVGMAFVAYVGMATQSVIWALVALSGVAFLWLCVVVICVASGNM